MICLLILTIMSIVFRYIIFYYYSVDLFKDFDSALLYLFKFTIGDNCFINLLCRSLADNGFGEKTFLG